jgi:hypothetical protein
MKMQLRKILTSVLILTGLLATSCEKVLGPDNDNHSTTDRLYTDPAFAEGLLLNGYTGWANNYGLDEIATDDAVTNIKGSQLQRMATGEWSALFTPVSVWSTAYQKIYYLNYFLSIVDDVDFAWDDRTSSADARDQLFKQRYTGEAKVLRAWYNFELLKNHGGIGEDGKPYGFIILKSVPDRNADFHRPRNSYEECVNFIMEDLNDGISLLPNKYGDKAGDPVYNIVFGNNSNKNLNRIDGRFAKALKSRVALYVASQSIYNASAKWDSAAVASARLLRTSGGGINGLAGMSTTGKNFWQTYNDAEIIFRRDYFNSNSREVSNFPPSRFGNGQTNPSQNLVDAFPMANGYPINHPSANYNPQDPYAGRDPRLKLYIVYNGNDLNGTKVYTTLQDAKDGLNQTVNSSRTGYYLKKLLQPNVNLTPTVMSTQRNFYTLFRYTEIFLNYAEAANEAWGPDADPNGYGFTPRTIIAKIRTRAGIPAADPYLASITDQAGMRELIRNERRLELCFEGFRFWDMRRWELDLNDPVKGILIDNGAYTVIDVEQRAYQPHMKYGPIPYQEVLKNNLTVQNQGW